MERFIEEKPNTHEVILDTESFFNRDAQVVAKELLGKLLQHKIDGIWVSGKVFNLYSF